MSSINRSTHRFGFLAALFLASLAAPAYATFQPKATSDYPDEKRHLCYTLDKAVADDALWVSWIDNAIANWNAADTGWTFRKCTDADKIPDVRFSFGKSEAGAQGNFRATGTEYYQIIIQQNVVGLKINGKTITAGGDKGWRLEDGSGQVMLDPELVMEHEISHALRLSHVPGQCNNGDLEEPICPGNHNNPVGRKPSASDIAEAKKSFNDRTPAHAAADSAPKKNETTPMFGGLETGAFKISENESPLPTDRVFFTYNHFSNNFNTLQQETFGFEKTFLGGDASVGVRLPFSQSGGDSSVGDLSVLLKYAFLRDSAQPDNVLSGGLVLTLPTSPNADLVLFQPFVAWNRTFGDFYLQGFHSIVIPSKSTADTLLFNDVASGYWIYRAPPDQWLTGVIPTVELHLTTNAVHSDESKADLTLGAHLQIYGRQLVGVGISFPLSGPRPFDMETTANFNFRF